MTMAEPERRTGKTPLKKQPEIEEVEEGDAETDGSPNSDKSDTTITAGNDTAGVQSSTTSPDSEAGDEIASPSPDEGVQHPEYKPVRTNSQSKMKTLQRAVALCEDGEDMSPPPDTITVTYTQEDEESVEICEAKLEKAGSDCSEAGTSMTLSRESSLDTQYKDSTGIDLEEFIKKTLHKSVKDRKMILQLARDLKKFIKEPKHQFLQFAEMSSYDRMLVHRISAFFGLDHNVDQSGKSVIVSKTKITRIPDFSFEEHIQKADLSAKKKILPRRAPSLEERGSKGSERYPSLINNRAKSLEERQKSYDEAKARIFKNGEGGSEDFLTCTPLLSANVSRSGKSSLMSSKEDLASSRQHSTDSSGYGSSENTGKQARLCTAKAHSYGGYSVAHTLKYQGPASLSKADSIGSGGSFDCGSGRPYPVPTSPPGSHSDYSPLSRSSSTGPIPSPQTSAGGGGGTQNQNSSYAFLVAMDPTNIPPGSMIVNPQTLQPHINPDGSLYRYDPAQPPPWLPALGSSSHPSTPSSVSFPTSMPAQYSNDHDVSSRLSNFSISQSTDIIESLPPGPGPNQQMPQGPHIVMGSQQPYQAQSPYLQQTYFPGPQGVTGQPVRYHYPVPYQLQGQGSVDGQTQQSHSASVPHIGQFSQPYVQAYPSNNYPNVMVQPSVSQNADMSGSGSASQSGMYSAPHPDGSIPTYSIQYGPYSQSQVGQPAQSPVFYSVSSTNPHLGYVYTGPTGSTIRPTTPPSQGSSVPNQSLAINMAAQPVNFQHQGGGAGGGHMTATSPQYGTYPMYPQLHQQAAAMRPVNQVVQIPGVQSHVAGAPSPQQPFSIVRTSMQMNLPGAGNMAPQAAGGAGIGQHAVGFKGYSINTCLQKPGLGGDSGKDGGPTPTMLPGNLGHISGHVTSSSAVRPQQLGAGDLRMLGPTFRPQLQQLTFGQRGGNQQPPTQTSNKPRE